MEHSFWSSRWDAGRIGFHLDRENPNLARHWPGVAPGTGRVLVPLCGKSHDLDWLAEQGHEVVGVEFVRSAVDAFFSERGLTPEHGSIRGVDVLSHGKLTLIAADFFELSTEQLPVCDWVYDRAALVAIKPDKRREYVQQLHHLTKSGAGMMLVNFEHDIGSGPPFSVQRDELARLCDSLFELELREERDILEADSRFAGRGATFILEQVWFGRRLD